MQLSSLFMNVYINPFPKTRWHLCFFSGQIPALPIPLKQTACSIKVCAPSFSAKDSTLSIWDSARYTLAILCYKLRQRERHFTHTQIKIPFPQCLTRTIFSYIRHIFVALFFVSLSFYFILNLSNLLKYTNFLNTIFYLCYGGKTSVFSKKKQRCSSIIKILTRHYRNSTKRSISDSK